MAKDWDGKAEEFAIYPEAWGLIFAAIAMAAVVCGGVL